MSRGAASFLRTPEPGAVPSLLMAGPLSSPATGPLLLSVARLGVVVSVSLSVSLFVFVSVSLSMLVLVFVFVFFFVVVHEVGSRALLASRGCLLLAPLAGPGATVGSHCLAL